MKQYRSSLFILLSFLCSVTLRAQDTAAHNPPVYHPTYELHTIMPTVAIGFINGYRNNYSLPAGFEKNNTSGFAPLLLKLEYGVGSNISLAATFGYDAFIYNMSQQYQGFNGPFVRYRADDFRMLSGGIAAFYHLGKIIPVKRLDPFIGVGLSLNNIRYSAYPSGDTTATKLTHTVTPYIKVGARYYISNAFSLFADLGYDKPAIISLGFSCRFFSHKEKENNNYSEKKQAELAPVEKPYLPDTIKPVKIAVVSEPPPAVIKPEEQNKEILPPPVTNEEGAYKNLRIGNVYPVEGFYFGFNKADVYTGEINKLNDSFELLSKNPKLKIQIRAYSDCRGNVAANLKISLRRAQSYKKYMESKGISANRISCKGFGIEHPEIICSPCSNCSEGQHQKNRRIEFKVVEM